MGRGKPILWVYPHENVDDIQELITKLSDEGHANMVRKQKAICFPPIEHA